MREVRAAVPGTPLGIHTHNDAECAVANSLAAVEEGARLVQGTINGYGERCGNANLVSIIPSLALKMGHEVLEPERLAELTALSNFVAETANLQPDDWAPYVGMNAFAHKGGMHQQGMNADARSYEHIDPTVVGNDRRVLVSELSGRGTILAKARELGLDVDEDPERVAAILARVKDLEHEGYHYETADGSFELLIERETGVYEPLFTLESFRVITEKRADGRVETEATVKVFHNGERIVATHEGNGPVNALDGALRQALEGAGPRAAGHRARQLQGPDPRRDQGHGRRHPRAPRLERRHRALGRDRREREHHRGVLGGAGRQPRARRPARRAQPGRDREVSGAQERIPLAKPVIGDRERELVDEVLRSGQLSLGPMVPRFEQAWCDRIGVQHAVAVSSGTAGLHLCLHALGLGPGDEVVTSSFSFVASANAILFTGATPVFAEVDPLTFNMDPAAVEAAITPRTKAILIVNIFGYPADVPALVEIADRHGLARVEDACQTIDGTYDGRKLGTFGHPAVYGFYANKQLTTAEGGVVLTDDAALASKLGSLRNQGRSDDGAWLVHSRLGFNYRLSDVHSRHRRRPARAARRPHGRPCARRPPRTRSGWPRSTASRPMYEGPQPRSWFVYAPRLDPDLERDRVIGDLDAVGVSAKPYLPCIHLQPFYQDEHGHRPGEFPVTEAISASTIALPFFPEMTEAQVERVCEALAVAIAGQRSAAGAKA